MKSYDFIPSHRVSEAAYVQLALNRSNFVTGGLRGRQEYGTRDRSDTHAAHTVRNAKTLP